MTPEEQAEYDALAWHLKPFYDTQIAAGQKHATALHYALRVCLRCRSSEPADKVKHHEQCPEAS